MIGIERYNKLNLRNYALSIGDISVMIWFHKTEIWKNSNNAIIQYDIVLDRENKTIEIRNNNLIGKLIDVELINGVSVMWTAIEKSDSINHINLSFPLFHNLKFKAIGRPTSWEELKYFLYTGKSHDDSDYISIEDKNALKFKIAPSTFHSLLQLAPEINNYCQHLLNNNK